MKKCSCFTSFPCLWPCIAPHSSPRTCLPPPGPSSLSSSWCCILITFLTYMSSRHGKTVVFLISCPSLYISLNSYHLTLMLLDKDSIPVCTLKYSWNSVAFRLMLLKTDNNFWYIICVIVDNLKHSIIKMLLNIIMLIYSLPKNVTIKHVLTTYAHIETTYKKCIHR